MIVQLANVTGQPVIVQLVNSRDSLRRQHSNDSAAIAECMRTVGLTPTYVAWYRHTLTCAFSAHNLPKIMINSLNPVLFAFTLIAPWN